MFKDDYDLRKLKLIKPQKSSFKMYVTPRYLDHYVDHAYEPFSIELLNYFLKEDSTFVDVGAHYGFYLLNAALSGKNIRTFAVEAIRENCEVLNKNIELNRITNVSVVNVAASDRKDHRPFNKTEASDSSGFYEHPLTKTKRMLDIRTESLDSLLRKEKRIGFIKIDVEGHEINVLEGMRKTIHKHKHPVLLIEFNPACQELGNHTPRMLLALIESLGYEIYFVDEQQRKLYRYEETHLGWEKLLEPYTYCNILCINKKQSMYVSYFSHTGALGGAEKSLQELLLQLRSYGTLSHVTLPMDGPFLSTFDTTGVGYDIVPYTWWCHTEHTSIDRNEYLASHQNLYRHLQQLKRLNPHVVVTNTLAIPWGAYAAFLLNKPHLWYINEYGEKDHGFNFLHSFAESKKLMSDLSHGIVCNSRAVEKEFSQLKPAKKVIYYSIRIPSEKIAESIESPYKKADSVKLIIAGNVTKGKGQDQAIRATVELVKSGFNLELLVLGHLSPEDPYYKKLERYFGPEYDGYIHFVDFVENPYPYIRESDILLMCSKSEAFGRVTVEAMLLKKPVIGADTGATSELINNNVTGLLYEFGNISSLTHAIQTLASDSKKRALLGRNAYRYAQQTFTSAGFAGTFSNLFRTVVNQYPNELAITKNYLSDSFSESIQTSQFRDVLHKQEQDAVQIANLQAWVDTIKRSKFYRVWRLYCKIRDKITNNE